MASTNGPAIPAQARMDRPCETGRRAWIAPPTQSSAAKSKRLPRRRCRDGRCDCDTSPNASVAPDRPGRGWYNDGPYRFKGRTVRDELEILFEDNHLIAVAKPAGVLSTHFDGTHETLDRAVKAYLKIKH